MVGENKTFVCLLSAANGVGKTAAGANIVAHILFGNSGNQYFDGLPLFDKFPYPKKGRIVSDPATIKSTTIPELKKWLPPDRYTSGKAGKGFDSVWVTDTKFEFDIMTYEQDAKEFESATLGWAWFDEPPPLAIFKATVARMRRGGIIFITATPLTGSSWMYDHIMTYDGDVQGQRDFVEADVEAACIEHGVRGHLHHDDIMRMVSEYDDDDKQARVFGKFQHLVGIVFKNFKRKIHVIKPFYLNRRDFIVGEALDPHPRNPDAVMWLAVDRKGTKYIVDELYGTFKTGELAERITRKAERYRIEKRIADPSAFVEDKHQTDPGAQTLAATLYNKYNLQYDRATKDRRAADRRIRDALDFEMSGEELLVTPELYIFDTCVRTIWELEHLVWDDWRGKAGERKSPMEKPVDKDDHMIENLGRLLLQEMIWSPMPTINTRTQVGVKSSKDFDPYD